MVTHPALEYLPSGRVVRIGDREIELTRTEHALMRFFAENEGETLTYRQIAGGVFDHRTSDASIRVWVYRLREKLGDYFPVFTVLGFGYRHDRQSS